MVVPVVYPNTRHGLKILMIILAAVCLAISVFVFLSWYTEKKTLEENGQPDFNTLEQSDLTDGMYVSGNIELAMDCYAEEYDTTYGIRTSEESDALYYLVPVYDTNSDGTITIRYFVTYEAKPKDFDTMDQTVAQMWSNDPLTAKLTLGLSQVRDMPGDLQQYMDDWINDKAFYQNGSFVDWCIEYNIFGTTNREEIASKVTPYVIYRTSGPENSFIIACIFAGLAVLCFILFLVLKHVKRPIKGVVDTPLTEDFSRVREMDTPPAEGENHDGFNP